MSTMVMTLSFLLSFYFVFLIQSLCMSFFQMYEMDGRGFSSRTRMLERWLVMYVQTVRKLWQSERYNDNLCYLKVW
ncbi:hypothetical protein Bca4012_006440 [Brassica carinata]